MTDCWGLKGSEAGYMNLDVWDPRQKMQDAYKVVALSSTTISEMIEPIPIYPQYTTLGGGSSSRPLDVKTIELPSQKVFEIRGSHLLVLIKYRVKERFSKNKTKIGISQKIMLIPANLKVLDLVKALKDVGKVSGLYKMPNSERMIQTTDPRTATELGWGHGTELMLEML